MLSGVEDDDGRLADSMELGVLVEDSPVAMFGTPSKVPETIDAFSAGCADPGSLPTGGSGGVATQLDDVGSTSDGSESDDRSESGSLN